MIVYKRHAVRRYKYGGSGIMDIIISLLARYTTKAMLATGAKSAMRGTFDAAKKAIPHLMVHEVATTIQNASKKQKKVEIVMKHSQEPQLKKASVDTGGIDINTLIDRSGIILDYR